MSCSSDSKSQVGDSNVTTTTGKLKVKTGGKKEKKVEEIMQDFLEEKDNEKWHYFIDKLGKRDSALLKRLLLSKCDKDTLDELFNSNAHKSDHYVDSNADDDSNGDIKKYLCDECPERFFKIKGLLIHYKHAHNDDSATTEDKSSTDKYVLVSSSSADELEMLKKNADKSDTDKVKPIDLTESEAPEEETNSESDDKETEEKDSESEPKKEIVTEDKQTEEKDGETVPNKGIVTEHKKTEEKDGESEPTKDKQTEDEDGESEPTKDKKTEDKDGETEPNKDIVTEDKQTEDKDSETEPNKDIVTEHKKTEEKDGESEPNKDIVTEHKENSGSETEGFSFGDDKGDSNVTGSGKSNVTKEMLLNQVKEDFTEAFEKKSDNGSSKESLETFQKGDHVLVAGVNRKLPAIVGDRLEEDDFVEVNFYRKTKDKGWSILDVVHVVKLNEIERKISPPTINVLSRTRAFLEFKDLEDMSVTESSDTSFDIQ